MRRRLDAAVEPAQVTQVGVTLVSSSDPRNANVGASLVTNEPHSQAAKTVIIFRLRLLRQRRGVLDLDGFEGSAGSSRDGGQQAVSIGREGKCADVPWVL